MIAALMGVSCGSDRESSPAPDVTATIDDGARADVEVATVERRDLVRNAALDGQLGYGRSRALPNYLRGTVTWLPQPGDRVEQGGVLYRVDEAPTVVMYGEVPAYRSLRRGDEGADVEQLQRGLNELGIATVTVDGRYGPATQQAVRRWQEQLGVDVTGSLARGRVTFASGPVRIASLEVGLGSDPGAAVLRVTGLRPVVTLELAVSDRHLLSIGQDVEAVLPDGASVAARVEIISPVATAADEGGGGPVAEGEAGATIAVELAVERTRELAFEQAPVEILVTRTIASDVLVVPVAALLALSEGGYAVERVHPANDFVRVAIGGFADGFVEVQGDLDAGDRVVTA